jgi:hypothetical protein
MGRKSTQTMPIGLDLEEVIPTFKAPDPDEKLQKNIVPESCGDSITPFAQG